MNWRCFAIISKKVIEAINVADRYSYIRKVGVFGSYSRNEENTSSDIDILIDYDNSDDGFLDDIDGFMEDFEKSVEKVNIDYVTLHGLQKSKNEEIKTSILNDVIWIYSK